MNAATADIALGSTFMASQTNDIEDLPRLREELRALDRQIRELFKARKNDEGRLLQERYHQASAPLSRHVADLRRQIADLRKTRRYAEAVPLAERLAEAVEVLYPASIAAADARLELAELLIDLAELLIASGRTAEAELLLQRALGILTSRPSGEAALRERFSHIDTSRLVQSVSELRSLLNEVRYPNIRMRSIDPTGGPPGYSSQHARERPERWLEEDRPTRSQSVPPPVASAPAPSESDPLPMPSTWRQPAERTLDQLSALHTLQAQKPEPSSPEGALAIEAGRLAYQIPDRMWVGVQETVEVRLGAVIAKEIMQGFVGRGDVKLEHVPIVETMSVSLVCEPGTFDIDPRSKETQLVKPDLVKGTAFHQDDFARWKWVVTPRQSGEHTLLVKVSAAIRDSRGLPTTSSLPDKIIAVTVRVHLVRAVTGAFWRVAPGLTWAVATTLVGIFTHEYWWPYVRDTVLPAIRATAGMS
jgi:tetratricopeptide (TPR) repeat protein